MGWSLRHLLGGAKVAAEGVAVAGGEGLELLLELEPHGGIKQGIRAGGLHLEPRCSLDELAAENEISLRCAYHCLARNRAGGPTSPAAFLLAIGLAAAQGGGSIAGSSRHKGRLA